MSSTFQAPSGPSTGPSSVTATGVSSNSPSPTPSGGGGGGGGGSQGSIPASASLYLYTFLATLILLLSISGAIIFRSFVIRRRNRQLMDEAMRNGTWTQPSSTGGRPKVDLSKKPVLWDAYVNGSPDKAHVLGGEEQGQSKHGQTDWDWDSIRPFSAAYLSPPSAAPAPTLRGSNDTTTITDGEAEAATTYPRDMSYTRRLAHFIRPDGARASQPYPLTERRVPGVDPDTSAPRDRAGPPKQLRVAVLIAMPQESTKSEGDTTMHPSASSLSLSMPTPPLPEDEKPIPLVEFGVAEIVVRKFDEVRVHRKYESGVSAASGSGSIDP